MALSKEEEWEDTALSEGFTGLVLGVQVGESAGEVRLDVWVGGATSASRGTPVVEALLDAVVEVVVEAVGEEQEEIDGVVQVPYSQELSQDNDKVWAEESTEAQSSACCDSASDDASSSASSELISGSSPTAQAHCCQVGLLLQEVMVARQTEQFSLLQDKLASSTTIQSVVET